jgi:hypothetical protein
MAVLWINNKPDIYQNGKAVMLRWSVLQVDPDHRQSGGSIAGKRGKDHPNNGRNNYVFYRLYVPGLSPLLKGRIEPAICAERREWGEEAPEPEQLFPRSYYLDYGSLPDWAKIALEAEGEITLPPHLAYQVIKRYDTQASDRTIFEYFEAA